MRTSGSAEAAAIIAEDEQPQREELRGLLARLWPELEVVAECGDGFAALEAIESLRLALSLRGKPDKLPVSSAFQRRFKGM